MFSISIYVFDIDFDCLKYFRFRSLMPCIVVFRTRVYFVFDASIFELFDMYMFNSEVGRNVIFDVFLLLVQFHIISRLEYYPMRSL